MRRGKGVGVWVPCVVQAAVSEYRYAESTSSRGASEESAATTAVVEPESDEDSKDQDYCDSLRL